MGKPPKNILFTGLPGCGKTTLIERIYARCPLPARGFFTREIREGGRRTGFSIVTLDGQRGVLARRDLPGPPRVGPYGVALEELERLAVPAISCEGERSLLVIDEIGKMECLSEPFRTAVTAALDSALPVIGSLPLRGGGFIERIRSRNDLLLVTVTPKNRDALSRRNWWPT